MRDSHDFDFVILEWDQRDYDSMPLRWRKSCTRMAAMALGVDIDTFADMLGDDDNRAYFRLQFEVIALRLAMQWFLFSEIDTINNFTFDTTPDYTACPPTVERTNNAIMNNWD